VPCYNEETTISATCKSLLALDYPQEKLEIILVDDGSTDTTPSIMAQFISYSRVRIITKKNGGKHTALNAGIASTDAEFIGCLDADSFVDPDALREIVPCFNNPQVVATIAAISIHEPKNILQHMQYAEFAFGITLRHTFASINGLNVTPGPFSFYRREIIEKLGGFRYAHQSEDLEMALRIQQAGYTIEKALHARVYTKAPDTIAELVRQRTRWTTGFLRNVLGEYRGLIGNLSHDALGMFVLPSSLLAIGSSIILFFLMIFELTRNGITTIEIHTGIPLSYSLMPNGSFDWFYFPTNLYLFLGITTLMASVSLIVIGKYISKIPGNLALGLISYTFLYGFISPLWLLQGTADFAFGKNRRWR
jgi:cellulose synthase/poly-beta-1,6-N-acetylglucosamine synthase-like glycosyltransferase